MTAAEFTADAFLEPKQIAATLRVSYGTVLAWIRAGELRAIALGAAGGKPYRVTPAELARFLTARTAGPAADPGGEPVGDQTAPAPAGPQSPAPRARGRRGARRDTGLVSA